MSPEIMNLSRLSEVEDAARSIVQTALQAGTIELLTPRLVRQKLEQNFACKKGTFDTVEYRVPLNNAIRDALNEMPQVTQEPVSAVEPKVDATKATTKSALKSKSKAQDIKPSKESKKEYKSAALITDSDDEMDKSPTVHNNSSEKKGPKRKFEIKAEKSNAEISPKRRKVEEVPVPIGVTAIKAEVTTKHVEYKSDSELSVLIDEPPKRKRKSKGSDSAKVSKKTTNAAKGKKGQKDISAGLSKDDDTIKRLKSYVLACGVRKVWSKVFKDINSQKDQIEKLKSMLSELGMTGRLSLEQAKSIKEKRELAQELEDVQRFEKTVVGIRPSSGRTSASKAIKEDGTSEDDSGSETDIVNVKRRPKNARQSIMAFLSDEDDD